MVLTDKQIAQRVKDFQLIDSYYDECLTSIGYDLRAKQFYMGNGAEDSVTLLPNESAFVESVEIVSMPNDLLGKVYLKNSRIRLGLTLDAPVYQPGHKTRIYFRVTNVSADSITLYAGDKYAMVVFEQLEEEPEQTYNGVFRDEFNFRGLGDYKDIYKRQRKEIEKKTEDLKELERSIYGNVLSILAIFMALFSFLTMNVSLSANSATMEQYLIFNVLLLGGISFLVALLNMATKKAKWAHWIPAAVCFVIALLLYL